MSLIQVNFHIISTQLYHYLIYSKNHADGSRKLTFNGIILDSPVVAYVQNLCLLHFALFMVHLPSLEQKTMWFPVTLNIVDTCIMLLHKASII